MGASQSFLSSPDYGYDYVLAVTQDSINATALTFLHERQPVVAVCYIYDDAGDPQQIDYSELRKKAGGADPFALPDSGPDRDTAISQLDDAGFMFGFQAAMGLPEGFAPAGLPDIVTLGATSADPVVYRLLCRNFLLVELTQIPHKKPVLKTFAQPKGPAGTPWIFTYTVPLIHEPVSDNNAFLTSPEFANLPTLVQSRLSAHPEDFTIRHLLFEFNKASSSSRPEISGVDRVLQEKLYEDFSVKYFAQMAAAGPPVVAVTPEKNDPLADLKTSFSVDPSPTDPKLSTLNYLCATTDHVLPSAKPFAWQWVEPTEADSFDGVCVMNRNDLVDHLRSQLTSYVEGNKWLPQPVEVEVYLTKYFADFGVVERGHDWAGHYPDNLHINTEKLDTPATGSTLLHWQFDASREFDYLSGTSWMLGKTSFELTVSCVGNVLTVDQHALVYCKLVMVTFDRSEWNLVDVGITDTFTLATEHDGTLTASRTSKRTDNSSSIGSDFAVPDLKSRFENIQHTVTGRISETLVDVPLSLINTMVFPGGKGFFFKDVAFSDHQDLVAHITYTDPS